MFAPPLVFVVNSGIGAMYGVAKRDGLPKLRCVTVHCSVPQCVAGLIVVSEPCVGWQRVISSQNSSVLQCVAVWHIVVQCGAVSCSTSQFVAVCCSELRCVAVCHVVSTRDKLHELRGIFRKESPIFVAVFCKRGLYL